MVSHSLEFFHKNHIWLILKGSYESGRGKLQCHYLKVYTENGGFQNHPLLSSQVSKDLQNLSLNNLEGSEKLWGIGFCLLQTLLAILSIVFNSCITFRRL